MLPVRSSEMLLLNDVYDVGTSIFLMNQSCWYYHMLTVWSSERPRFILADLAGTRMEPSHEDRWCHHHTTVNIHPPRLVRILIQWEKSTLIDYFICPFWYRRDLRSHCSRYILSILSHWYRHMRRLDQMRVLRYRIKSREYLTSTSIFTIYGSSWYYHTWKLTSVRDWQYLPIISRVSHWPRHICIIRRSLIPP
jgi:hypothetical protein